MFAKYHYLSGEHNNAAKKYIATINGEIVGFLSVLHLPHPVVKNMKRVHRLVILPDYQGAGFGIMFLEKIAEYYKKQNYRFTITTSAPSLIFALKKNLKWRCGRFGRGVTHNGIIGRKSSSCNRLIAGFEFLGK